MSEQSATDSTNLSAQEGLVENIDKAHEMAIAVAGIEDSIWYSKTIKKIDHDRNDRLGITAYTIRDDKQHDIEIAVKREQAGFALDVAAEKFDQRLSTETDEAEPPLPQ